MSGSSSTDRGFEPMRKLTGVSGPSAYTSARPILSPSSFTTSGSGMNQFSPAGTPSWKTVPLMK